MTGPRGCLNASVLHDEAEITVRSGKGGDGCVSFRREARVPKGGPDGGDGGRGGDVVLVASRHRNTLSPYVRTRRYQAEAGQQGGGRQCYGRDGADLIIELPCGTQVRDAATSELLVDLASDGQRTVILAGGRGGKGNVHFKSSINQTPRQATPGQEGGELTLRLDLKLIADVGLLGLPNAGKSTLLARLSAARPRIGNYPFTTIQPQLGVIEVGERSLVMADIPGLIEGAAEGRGLGHRFLRHVERCPLLLHLVDGSEGDADELIGRVRVLDDELRRFSPLLADRPQLIALTKLDARPELAELAAEIAIATCREVLALSGVSGQGIDRLLARLLALIPSP